MSVREALRRSVRSNRDRVNGTGVIRDGHMVCMAYQDVYGHLWASVWNDDTHETLFHGRFYRAMELFRGV